MSRDRISVTFQCNSCGANPASLMLPDDYTDNSVASCKDCGIEFGRYGDVKAKALAQAREAVTGHVRKALKLRE